jgi:hypothetical protein
LRLHSITKAPGLHQYTTLWAVISGLWVHALMVAVTVSRYGRGCPSHSTLWWFFTLQVLPVYCIIFRGVSNAYQFWSDWILSSLMVPRRRAEPAPFFCGYTGSWFVPPRRRRQRGESPIRVP